jgi:hypothetical protein
MSILLAVVRDTPCMYILLAMEMDTLCKSILLMVESYTPCPHVHTSGWGGRGDSLHNHTCWQWKRIHLHIHTAGDGKDYTLHIHSAGVAVERDTPCMSISQVVEGDTPCWCWWWQNGFPVHVQTSGSRKCYILHVHGRLLMMLFFLYDAQKSCVYAGMLEKFSPYRHFFR